MLITNVNVSAGSQYPETWLQLLKNGVNNISFNQVIGNTDEPLYTVLGFFPDKLQVTIDTSLVTADTVRTFVHSNKIIITGKKLECSTLENVAGCREIEVSRTIIIPLPMKHTQSKATIMQNANIYMLLVQWDLSF
ncbi:hypothetical protein O3M35_010366 [Rhynocoris fuscipes]|uniref:SHSP domain-containing protein n=1 Tax=Rhynocoris fuscipes TaxID=488301 RepID=A0AAW1D1F7_9HEMI